jgi:hypothetical protein
LFGAKCDLLPYDLTSTYFEGQAGEIPAARRGYSRDSRPDALQLILAMVVTEEGLPLPTKSLRVTGQTSALWRKSWTRWNVNMASWIESGSMTRVRMMLGLNAPTIAPSASVGPPNAQRQARR